MVTTTKGIGQLSQSYLLNIYTMKEKLLTLAALALSLHAAAQTNPLWMRYSNISPDGQTIAFEYKGDIFTVPVTGGQARQLTSNAAYDAAPVWSPDGRQIAFASAREGSLDVYVMSQYGGAPKRLTTDSGSEMPVTWKDNEHVLFQSATMPSAKSIIFASAQFPQIYEVSTKAERPRLFSEINMEDMSINANGDILYHDMKGYEDPFRKHHKSPITRDIWLLSKGKYTKLSSFEGEDRTPVWAQGGNAFYYTSEEDGTFNVYRRNLDGSGKQQLTHFKGNPVRYLSASKNGTLCFGYDGELYTLKESGQPQKVSLSIVTDKSDDDLIRQTLTYGATEATVSPNGKELAFVVHGEVYVTSIDYRTTKQITDTPEQERSISFAPDGRSIVYASERNGLWQIYQTSIKKEGEKLFTYATELKEEQLVKSDSTSFQPAYSPDGKSVAFLENRGTLRAVDVKSKKVRTLMEGKFVYSYSDGDIWFEWSPDSKWLLSSYIGHGGWNNSDIALVPADGSQKITNLTNSGYGDGNGKWVLGGKAMLFESDRAGYRSHGSWGAESDAYIMFFDQDAFDKFRMNKEERELLDEADKAKKAEEEKKPVDVSKKKEVKKEEPLQLDLANAKDRVLRLTVNSSRLGDYLLDPKGTTLYYLAAFEGGYDLWKHDLVENKTQIVMKDAGGGGMEADKDFKFIYLATGGGIKQIDMASGAQKTISYEARFNYRPYKEREYMFNHVWQQVQDKFYDPKIHGVDWAGYRKTYEKFLPYINNNYDFRDMLSEMLGELNGSHTGARYYGGGASMQTATLGLFLDPKYEGDGLKVQEVLKRGPFDMRKTDVEPGCIIEAIDGEKILAGKDYNYMLDGKAGRKIRVSVFNPKGSKRFDVEVKAISKGMQNELLYKRWVERNRRMVDSLSNHQLAYVHVKAMDSESFRQVYSDLMSDSSRMKKAVIVDERHNGGGWLHDDLCTLLSGKQYQEFVPRGRFIGYDPWNKWVKPSCVLVCEDDYSNGHGFPFVYQTLGIGKVIGAPVAGTMTAVWWETMIDRSMVFGIPQVGCRDMNGVYGENHTLQPDVVVYNSPEDYLNANDEQLKRAVQEMLKK